MAVRIIRAAPAPRPNSSIENASSTGRDQQIGVALTPSPVARAGGVGTDSSPSFKTVLNTGSGHEGSGRLHPLFRGAEWKEVRLDIDPTVKPDVLGTVVDMKDVVADASCDAIWSSHNIEHLHTHEVPRALREFVRILKPTGFALITCPDLAAIAKLVLEIGEDKPAYTSGMGPITPLDMLFGHSASIARGSTYMAHNTGFSRDRLGQLMLEAGFQEVRVSEGSGYDLWALGLRERTDTAELDGMLAKSPQRFLLPDY